MLPIDTSLQTIQSATSTRTGTSFAPDTALSSSSSSSTSEFAGAGAGAAVGLIVLVVLVLLYRRKHQQSVPKGDSAGSLRRNMTDEEILASAQAITLDLHNIKNRVIEEPTMEWLEVPKGQFCAPPSTLEALRAFPALVRKELRREFISIDREIGSVKVVFSIFCLS